MATIFSGELTSEWSYTEVTEANLLTLTVNSSNGYIAVVIAQTGEDESTGLYSPQRVVLSSDPSIVILEKPSFLSARRIAIKGIPGLKVKTPLLNITIDGLALTTSELKAPVNAKIDIESINQLVTQLEAALQNISGGLSVSGSNSIAVISHSIEFPKVKPATTGKILEVSEITADKVTLDWTDQSSGGGGGLTQEQVDARALSVLTSRLFLSSDPNYVNFQVPIYGASPNNESDGAVLATKEWVESARFRESCYYVAHWANNITVTSGGKIRFINPTTAKGVNFSKDASSPNYTIPRSGLWRVSMRTQDLMGANRNTGCSMQLETASGGVIVAKTVIRTSPNEHYDWYDLEESWELDFQKDTVIIPVATGFDANNAFCRSMRLSLTLLAERPDNG